jgi:hypothetical protein
MEVYQLHVWLCEISPLIWRRLLVRRETGCHGGPVPSRGVLKELPVGRERPDQRPQGGQVAVEHQGPHQAAEAIDPYHVGRGELRRHGAGHEAPHRRGAQKDDAIQTQDAATLLLLDDRLADRKFKRHLRAAPPQRRPASPRALAGRAACHGGSVGAACSPAGRGVAPLLLVLDRRRRMGEGSAAELTWKHLERLIGSIRRECLEHLVVLHERHLRHILTNYFAYYHQWRTHLSLAMDCPVPRPVLAPDRGKVVAVPEVGGLHHHYGRGAA